ncbi:MAG: hypothetical protein ABSE63_05350 [Thermoguttaceae bacterium]|jgi:hypothetical protein
MSEKRINEELSAVEAALASLKPAAAGVDRDRVMFLAGCMSAIANTPLHQKQKIPWLWPCVTAVSLLLAIASSGMLFLRGTATGEKQAAYAKSNTIQTAENIPQPLWYEHTQNETPEVKQQRPRPSSERGNIPMDYLSLNLLIAEKGVDALPGPSWIPIGPEKPPRRDSTMQDEWKLF